MTHETFSKSYIAVGKVIEDLASNGYFFALPGCEQLPFDLIAISDGMKLARLQIKYRVSRNDGISIELVNSAGYTRLYKKRVDLTQVDAYAVYCPCSNKVYYIRVDEIPSDNKRSFHLRLVTPKNNQKKKIKLANDFLKPSRLFDMLA
jgi:hypothetical protein